MTILWIGSTRSTETLIGAVNTDSRRRKDGTLEGRNTDAYGFTEPYGRMAQRHIKAGYGCLGAGGAACADCCRACWIWDLRRNPHSPNLNRTQESRADTPRAGTRRRDSRLCRGGTGGAAAVKDSALLVNTTSLGMQGQPALESRARRFTGELAVVTDLVYAPLMTGSAMSRAEARQ